jgi:hypothetical protein
LTNNQVYKTCQDQKILITQIRERLQRLKGIQTNKKSEESFFEIGVIRDFWPSSEISRFFQDFS